MKVTNYNLLASNGKKIRVATMVTLDNGKEVRFTERMTKKDAIKNTKYQLSKLA